MSTILAIRVGLALAGIAVFLYGASMGVDGIRWAGMAFIAIALLLRFVRRQPPPPPSGLA